VNDLVLI